MQPIEPHVHQVKLAATLSGLRRLELRRKARAHNSNILSIGRDLRQLIIGPPVARCPASPTNKDIAIVVKSIQNVADNCNAILSIASTQLSDEGLTLVAGQERSQSLKARSESIVAESVLAAFLVEVLVQFEDEIIGAAVRVLDFEKSSGAIREAHGVGPVRWGEEDHLRCGAGATDGCDNGLRGGGPGVHVEVGLAFGIVRLVLRSEGLKSA